MSLNSNTTMKHYQINFICWKIWNPLPMFNLNSVSVQSSTILNQVFNSRKIKDYLFWKKDSKCWPTTGNKFRTRVESKIQAFIQNALTFQLDNLTIIPDKYLGFTGESDHQFSLNSNITKFPWTSLWPTYRFLFSLEPIPLLPTSDPPCRFSEITIYDIFHFISKPLLAYHPILPSRFTQPLFSNWLPSQFSSFSTLYWLQPGLLLSIPLTWNGSNRFAWFNYECCSSYDWICSPPTQ